MIGLYSFWVLHGHTPEIVILNIYNGPMAILNDRGRYQTTFIWRQWFALCQLSVSRYDSETVRVQITNISASVFALKWCRISSISVEFVLNVANLGKTKIRRGKQETDWWQSLQFHHGGHHENRRARYHQCAYPLCLILEHIFSHV